MAIIDVIYVEDSDTQFERYRGIFQGELLRYGMASRILHVKGNDALSAALKKGRPHVVLVDNRLQSGDEFEGLSIIARQKPRYPDIVFCLLSRETLTIEQFGLKTPNPDVIVSKTYFGAANEEYRNYVANEILKRIRRSFISEIGYGRPFHEMLGGLRALDSDARSRRKESESEPDQLSWTKKGLNELEFRSLLEQVSFNGDVTADSNQFDRIDISQLPGGYSGAVVLRLSVRASGARRSSTGVLKISPRMFSRAEWLNYNKYVKWSLPYTWRVDVLGTGRVSNFGAVCYSFVFEGQGEPISASTALGAADTDIIPRVCETILNPEKRTWYGEIRHTKKDASEYFSVAPFFVDNNQIDHREKQLVKLLNDSWPEVKASIDNGKLSVGSLKLTQPSRLLFTNNWGEVLECICHGDLNSNNIMYESNSGAVAFIDFQRTGLNHIYRDFVSLEAGIRCNWSEHDGVGLFEAEMEGERGILQGRVEGESKDFRHQCARVRMAAFQNFRDTRGVNRNHYYIASAIHYWWLADRFKFWTDVGRKRLLLGAIAALEYLDSVSGTPG